MVGYRRAFVPGGTFFFTVTLADRRSHVLVDHADALRHAFRQARQDRAFSLDAIVVLPDHLHAIMTLPDGDADFSGRWRRIKGAFTRRVAPTLGLGADRRGEYDLWQKRFWEHAVRDDRDLRRHLDYLHFNPVKHGLAGRVRDWPLSSFHRYVREGALPLDWGGDFRAPDDGDYGER